MQFNFENLDQRTRGLMNDEVDRDIQSDNLYISKQFNDIGIQKYPDLLKKAISTGSESSLSDDLKNENCIATEKMKSGKWVKVPHTANKTLAEGEFNRFYIRALCRRVIEDKNGALEIYRAKQVSAPRSESQMRIGEPVDSKKLLDDLRKKPGVDTALGVPSGPNSGLSVKITS